MGNKKKQRTDLTPSMEFRSYQIEVERKYRSSKKDWKSFIQKCKFLSPSDELVVDGPDTYYGNSEGRVLRWRYNSDKSELTTKARYSMASTLIREESDIEMKNTPVRYIISFIRALGFKKLFRIRKYCHIFWFDEPEGNVCAVIYRVTCRGKVDKFFIEIEAPKGASLSSSKRMIRKWEQILEIPSHRRINQSLFEIYSGKITPMVKRRGGASCKDKVKSKK